VKAEHHNNTLKIILFFIGNFTISFVTLVITIFSVNYLFGASYALNKTYNIFSTINAESSDFEIAASKAVDSYSTQEFTLGSLIDKEFDGTNFLLGDILKENEAYKEYYITYVGGGVKISGIMNVPHGEGPFPLLILNHGYINPSVYTNGRGLRREQDYLARSGFVVLHPDYRNHADSTPDNRAEVSLSTLYTEDVINAVVSVLEAQLPFIDESKIGMLGYSMGGGITLNAISVVPDLVDAAVLYAPVSGNYENIYNRWAVDSEDAKIVEEKYGTIDENPEFWKGLSSETFYDRITIPTMFHQGDNDDEIPLFWTDDTVDILENKNKDVTYHLYPNGPHEFVNEWKLFMERTVQFFREKMYINDDTDVVVDSEFIRNVR